MRIAQHNDGTFGGHTSTRRPVVLVYHQEFDRIVDAIAAQRQVKRWTRAKKEAVGGELGLGSNMEAKSNGWSRQAGTCAAFALSKSCMFFATS
jgi:predicted GIY-YIG superfamily endonuclease